MEFIRSSLLKDYTTATEVKKIDLPVNPLSHLIISMDAYNATDEATLAELLAFINKITVEHNGVGVCSLQSEDLYGVNTYLYGNRPVLVGKLATDNLHRCLSLIVPFGRRIFDPNECYPATRKGELTLSLDMTVPATSADNSTLNIEAVQLIGATPQRFLKTIMKAVSAPGATGENEVELPIGNKIAAMLLRLTTWPGASTHTYGVNGVKTFVDDSQYGYSYARAQCLTGDLIFHYDTQHGNIAAQGAIQPANILVVDFDPQRDDQFLLETEGKSKVHAVLDMGVDEATYLTTLELVDSAKVKAA
jgi:hypothetical protein